MVHERKTGHVTVESKFKVITYPAPVQLESNHPSIQKISPRSTSAAIRVSKRLQEQSQPWITRQPCTNEL